MHRARTVTAWAGAVVLVGLVSGVPAGAQSRKQLRISAPSPLGRIGQGTSVAAFQGYSHGLGSLQRGGKGWSGGVLSTSLSRAGRFSLNRGSSLARPATGIPIGTGVGGLSVPRTALGRGHGLNRGLGDPVTHNMIAPVAGGITSPTGIRKALTGAETISPAAARGLTEPGTALKGTPLISGRSLREEHGKGIGAVLADQDDTALGAARAYLQALEEASSSLLREQTEPITTLVPTQESSYRDHMAKGDRAFRANNFRGAFSEFRIANDLGNRDPESLICLAHTQFALSKYSYAKASYFLQEALRYMPELPLANLRPRGFYGSSAKYAEHLVSLKEYLERNPTDAEALLLMAYFRWFGEAQDVEATKQALARGLTYALKADNTHLVDAIETFWDGMGAAGKATGKLEPIPESAPATQPGPAAPAAAP